MIAGCNSTTITKLFPLPVMINVRKHDNSFLDGFLKTDKNRAHLNIKNPEAAGQLWTITKNYNESYSLNVWGHEEDAVLDGYLKSDNNCCHIGNKDSNAEGQSWRITQNLDESYSFNVWGHHDSFMDGYLVSDDNRVHLRPRNPDNEGQFWIIQDIISIDPSDLVGSPLLVNVFGHPDAFLDGYLKSDENRVHLEPRVSKNEGQFWVITKNADSYSLHVWGHEEDAVLDGYLISDENRVHITSRDREKKKGQSWTITTNPNGSYSLNVKGYEDYVLDGFLVSDDRCVHLERRNLKAEGQFWKFHRSNQNWMQSDIIRNKTLSSVTMPGTHNSGTYNSFLNIWANCQDLNVFQQLCEGVRYFDLRPALYSEVFFLKHFSQGARLEDVLNDVLRFLSESREFIILKFSHFENMGPSVYKMLVDFVKEKLKKKLCKKPTTRFANMKLEELLGKVLVVCDGDLPLKQKEKGIFVYRDWNSDKPGEGDLTVFDMFSETGDASEMMLSQLAHFNDFNGRCKNNADVPCDLFLLSWTLTPSKKNWFSVRFLATGVNPLLAEKVLIHRNKHGKTLNVLYLDFIETSNSMLVCNGFNKLTH